MNKYKQKSGRVLLDFYADWCGPCKTLGKNLEQYETEVSEVTLIKVDIDQEQDIAQAFNVRSIPTIIYMVDGEIINRAVGVKTVEQLKEFTKIK